MSSWASNLSGITDPAKGVSSWGQDIGKTDTFGNKARTRDANDKNAADAQRVVDKGTADAAAINNIDQKQKAAAPQVAANNAATSTALGAQADAAKAALATMTAQLAKDDPVKLAKQLSDQQDQVSDAKMKLANDQLQSAAKLTGLYSQLSTSYDDIGKRYADAVTGLSDAEKTQYRGTAQQDYAAMSAVGMQGASAQMRGSGGPVTGQMASVLSAQAQQGASSAYASAIQNMQNLDTQRRQMQEAMVTDTFNAQRGNIQTAGSLMQTQIADEGQARQDMASYLQAGQDNKANYQMTGMQTDINKNLSQYGAALQNASFQSGIANQQGVLRNDTIQNDLNTATYADQAGISLRNGIFQNQNAQEATAASRTGAAFSQDMAIAGMGFTLGTSAANVLAARSGQGGSGNTGQTVQSPQSFVGPPR